MESPNICGALDKSELTAIRAQCMEGYLADKTSRSDWEASYATAMNLAMQVKQTKTFPWDGCANNRFPLIAIASLMWHAKAYPTLVPAGDLVKVKTYGEQTQKAIGQARRIEQHMTYQLNEEDKSWEEEQDKNFLCLPIAGTTFKKSYFSPNRKAIVGEFVLPKDLVVNYWTKSLDTAPRITQIIEMSHNAIREKQLRGLYREVDLSQAMPFTDDTTAQVDQSKGITAPTPDKTQPYQTGEQHLWLDLDKDGYEEPYVVVFDLSSGEVLRIVARYGEDDIEYISGNIFKKGRVVNINAQNFYTKYEFIPSPNGAFYGQGFGQLLGPINESVDSTLNQLFDAGTMHILGGGFLGRGARIKGGMYSMKPFTYVSVDSSGDDLRKNVLPLQTREPSGVVFQLLQYLVTYAERIAGATETQVGENPGQNTPAETMRTMDANGQRIFQDTYKRVWRAEGAEFSQRFELTKLFIKETKGFFRLCQGEHPMVTEEDYRSGAVVVPKADPHIVSDEKRLQLNQMVMQLAQMMPGFFKMPVLMRRTLELMRVPDIDEIFDPNGQPPPNPKMIEMQIEQERLKLDQQKFEFDKQVEEVVQTVALMKAQSTSELNKGKIDKIQAEILKLLSDIDTSGENINLEKMGHVIALVNTLIGAEKEHMDDVLKTVELALKGNELEHKQRVDGVGKLPANKAISALPAPAQAGRKGGMGTGTVLPLQ